MQEIMEQYIDGHVEGERGSLSFSCAKIEISLQKDERVSGSFVLLSDKGRKVKGYIYSSNIRLTCDAKQFCTNELTVSYTFFSKGLGEGDTVKTSISIISDAGEYEIPVIVSVKHSPLETSLGNVKNLFHFANLAKTYWNEAVELFYSKQFKQIFIGNDRQFLAAYLGLSKAKGNEQNVEEFLLVINKKQKIEYTLKKNELVIQNPMEVSEIDIMIKKNGWGYTKLQIETEGEFLSLDQKFICAQDFTAGAQCVLMAHIDVKKLHKGINYGRIQIFNNDTSMQMNVTVLHEECKQAVEKRQKELKAFTCQLTSQYLAYKMGKIEKEAWLLETRAVLDKLTIEEEKNPVIRLYQAHLLITEERFNEAKWILGHTKSMLDKGGYSTELEAYYFYLNALRKRDEVYTENVIQVMKELYSVHTENWKIFWLQLYLDDSYAKNPAKKWYLLERQFDYGCTSPVLYLEAVQILREHDSLLTKLSRFEIQVCMFALKKQMLSHEMITQITYLAGREKQFRRSVYQILCACYEVSGEVRTLQVICAMLIKCNLSGKEYFKWYALAIEKQLRITRLYEYYMMSIDITSKEALPKMLLMYFAYHSELDYIHNAFLYANILRHEEEMPEMAQTYRAHIEQFVAEQIKKEHMNRDLAYLYKRVSISYDTSMKLASNMATLMFAHLVTVENKEIEQIVVVHTQLKNEAVYSVINCQAIIYLYSGDYQIFLQDANKNRYTKSVSYRLEKLMVPGHMIKQIQHIVKDHIGFCLYMCDVQKQTATIGEQNAKYVSELILSENIEEYYKKGLRGKLAQYYFEADKTEDLELFLIRQDPEILSVKERAELIRLMIYSDKVDEAMSWVNTYGAEGVTPKSLMRLLSYLLEREQYEENTLWIILTYTAFSQGKFDEVMLTYLNRFYHGTLKTMRDIWKEAKEYNVSAKEIFERILLQILFSAAYIAEEAKIFQYYIHGQPSTEITYAYLTRCSYDYVVKDIMLDDIVFKQLVCLHQKDIELNDICKLAAIQYYSDKLEGVEKEIISVLTGYISEFLVTRKIFPVFVMYYKHLPELEEVLDKVLLEYRAKPGSIVTIHYLIEGNISEQYIVEEMREIIGGIYTKQFTLFFGESVQYYITEFQGGKEHITESDTIHKSDAGNGVRESKFNMINDMAISSMLQDYDTFDVLLEEMNFRQYMIEELFAIETE